MSTWISLLRGVNLGKKRRLPMAALRTALTAAGLSEVRTYLQSGNVIAQSDLRSPEEISDLLNGVVAAAFYLDVPVMTRSPAELEQVIAQNPFTEQAAQRAHLVRVIFLASPPPASTESVNLCGAPLSGFY
jgi:uncharacterized protein (DUF1697 family)